MSTASHPHAATVDGVSPATRRQQSRSEEIANSVSHALGLVAAVAGTPVLLLAAARNGTTRNVVSAGVFAATMIVLYFASTLYHAVPHPPAKKILRRIDHGAIFLLIAGTYTPFTLGVLHGPWGWSLFAIVWALAIAGVALKVVDTLQHPVLIIAPYIAMGWLAVIAVRPLWFNLPRPGLLLLLAGGIAYTGGVVFYARDRIPYHHLLWHVCVLAGTAFHYFAVLWFAW